MTSKDAAMKIADDFGLSDLISYDILRTWKTREPGGLPSFSEGLGQDKKVHVHCNVCNTGNVAGAEVVQCYYETLYASVVRPKKELVRFRKVFLEPGEKKDVDFFIDQEEFSYYGKNMETVSSGMKLRISIGNSSDHLVSENIIIQ